MTQQENMILLEGVSKRYGTKLAVDQLSLAIPSGELFAFLGPNGAGKTTTIKMLTGLLRPSSGRVLIAGCDMAENSPECRRQLSYVPDQPHLYDKLSGRDFLRFTSEIHGLSVGPHTNGEAELIATFEMQDFIDDLAETYSHGMRQRLAFASALLSKPAVLIVDEPMVGLDPRSTRIVKDLLKETARRGTTVFMSTHTLSIVEEIADRVGIIDRGRLIRCGSCEELKKEIAESISLEEFFLKITAKATQ